MSLKSRITLLVLGAIVVAWCALLAVFSTRELDQRQHLDAALLQAHRIAWDKVQAESIARLEAAAGELVAKAAWEVAWRTQEEASIDRVLREQVAGQRGWRIDVFDEDRRLVHSTSAAAVEEPLLEGGWLSRVLVGPRPESGVGQSARDRYHMIAAYAFTVDGHRGVVAVGVPLEDLLPEFAGMVQGEVFLLTSRGREVAGTSPGLVAREHLDVSVREPSVREWMAGEGRTLLTVLQPLEAPGERRIGALLMVRDVTQARAREQRLAGWAIAAALGLLAVLGGVAFTWTRQALSPLERSVQVLNRLAHGDLHAAPEVNDQGLPDEAGQIARAVAALRREMLSLQALREERVRNRQQQERLIRRELKQLAANLDDDTRAGIEQALASQPRADGGAPHRELAELAHILGRLSGLITSQHERLVSMVRELQHAMASKALLFGLQQELEFARHLQLSILPRDPPSTPRVQVDALMVPAREVGGDFYDYFLIDEDRLALVVADVSGKGVPAAFFMAVSRTLLKSNALHLRRPADVLARLNEQLCAGNEQMMFVTAFFGVLHLRTGVLDFVNAGHNPPVIRGRSAQVRLLPRNQNVALAVVENARFHQGRASLRPGDTLLLYTDGIVEANDPAGRSFGEQRLLDTILRHQPVHGSLPEVLLREVRAFERGKPQGDDITCVALRYEPELATG